MTEGPRRWRLVGRQVDTVVFHVPRWRRATGHPLEAAGDWQEAGAGRSLAVADGVQVELDTQHSGPDDLRVTIGAAWTWRRGGLDRGALAELIGPLTGASVYRVDVAADFAAPSRRAIELLQERWHRENLRRPPSLGIPMSWGGPDSAKGWTVAYGSRGKAVQRRIYWKTSPYHWPGIYRYTPVWRRRGWRGVRCPSCDTAGELGAACDCGGCYEPAPVARLEIEWPRRYTSTIALADVDLAVGWLLDRGGRGRQPTLQHVPELLARRLLDTGRAVPRPRQIRRDPTLAGQIEHWRRVENAAAGRRAAVEAAFAAAIDGPPEERPERHLPAPAPRKARRRP